MVNANPIKHSPAFKDMTGQRFHMLTVLGYYGPSRRGQATWLCKCECGAEKVVHGNNLRRGHHKSCGCLPKQKKPDSISGCPEFRAYCSMLARCHGLNPPKRYGKRGIKVCDRWRQGFRNFIEDMGPRPTPGHSIDRKDNNGDYSPDNCRWATLKDQGRNRSTSRIIECFGLRLTLVEWAERTAISRVTIASRIDDRGWSAEKALVTPGKQERTTCCRGHLLSPENVRADSRGCLRCRKCDAERGRRSRLAERMAKE